MSSEVLDELEATVERAHRREMDSCDLLVLAAWIYLWAQIVRWACAGWAIVR